METVLKLRLLKDKIIESDVYTKKILKDISDCDQDWTHLNRLYSMLTTKLNETRQDLNDYKRMIRSIGDEDLKYQFEQNLACVQNQYEINMVVAKKTITQSRTNNNDRTRAKLFQYSSTLKNRLDSSKNQVKLSNESRANQASTLTEDLYTISKFLSNEVDRSGKNLEALVSSSSLATETSQELKTMSNYIANSKTLLSKYGRRELTDKILTILAFGFYFGCVIYVLLKRIYWK
ncbi:heat shock protein cognate 5 [Sarcoptes scabiei]|nr:heat shock protein cognate 5 [Sarcoptes scabiei]